MLNSDSKLQIDNKTISKDDPTYFIADIAANHDGDLSRARDLIYAAKEAGADAAKFQHFKAESIVSDFGFRALGSTLSHQVTWKDSVFNVYKKASLREDWTPFLKEACDKAGISFFSSPYDLDLVDHLDPFVPAYKIGSGDITWTEIIKCIASKGKPYILATGASTMEDVHRAVAAGLAINNKLALLQCNTNYTGSIENLKYVQLNVLKSYQLMFPNIILGLSDHTPGHATVLGAVALGARIIEKHFTDDTSRDGPDHSFSLDPVSWKDMVDRTRELEAALGGEFKQVEANEADTVIMQRRAIRAKSSLPKGHKLEAKDFEILRPCPPGSIPPYMLDSIIGRITIRQIPAGEALFYDDLDH